MPFAISILLLSLFLLLIFVIIIDMYYYYYYYQPRRSDRLKPPKPARRTRARPLAQAGNYIILVRMRIRIITISSLSIMIMIIIMTKCLCHSSLLLSNQTYVWFTLSKSTLKQRSAKYVQAYTLLQAYRN